MATTYTPNLGLTVEDNITSVSRLNLYKIDALAGSIVALTNSSDVIIRASNDIIITAGHDISVGTAAVPVSTLHIYADAIDIVGTTVITGLIYSYVDLDFTGGSLASIPDQASVVSANASVVLNTTHRGLTNNPHATTAAQVGSYTIAEVDNLLSLVADSADLLAHTGSTAAHGSVGDIVGVGNAQVLTNKTISALSNTIAELTNDNLSSGANIAYSKLNIAGAIKNTDVSGTAAIEMNKIDGLLTTLAAKEPTVTKGNLTTATSGVTITGGTGSVIGSGTSIGITLADSGSTGLLTSADWQRFNAMALPNVPQDLTTSTTGVNIVGGAGSLIGATGATVNIDTATNSIPGLLSAADHTTFAAKEPAVTKGNLTTSTTGVSIGSGTGVVIGTGTTVDIQTATNSVPGLLSAADHTTFAAAQPGDADLTAVAALTSAGIAVRTSADPAAVTWSVRTITGTSNRIDVTNGAGTAGNPTIDLDTTQWPQAGAGDPSKVLKATAANTAIWDTVSGALGYTPVNRAGDTMTGLLTLDNLGVVMDIAGAEPVSPTKGQMWWNTDHETVVVKMAGTDVTMRIGQEMFVRAINDVSPAATITRGQVVYVSGVSADMPTIKLAKADSTITADSVLGIAAETILTGVAGYIVTSGMLHDMYTVLGSAGEALSVGDQLYLSAAVAGGFTKILSPAPYHQVKLGMVMKAATAVNGGRVSVRIETGSHMADLHDVTISSPADRDVLEYDASTTTWMNYVNPSTITREPTGWGDYTHMVATWDEGNTDGGVGNPYRSLTITNPGGSYYYYIHGVRYTIAAGSTKTVRVTATEGTWYFYFNTSSTLVATQVFAESILSDNAYTFASYWDATNFKWIHRGEERHGCTMDWATHVYLHTTRGAAYESGGAITGPTLTNNDRALTWVGIDSLVYHDEDINHTLGAFAAGDSWRKLYRSGVNGDWRVHATYPGDVETPIGDSTLVTLCNQADGTFTTAARAYINEIVTGSWALTEVADNNYYNTYIFGTTNQVTGQKYVLLPGQQQNSNLGTITALGLADLALGSLPGPEFLPLYKITCRYTANQRGNGPSANTAGLRIYAVEDLRAIRSTGTAASFAGLHNNLSGRSATSAHPASAINTDITAFNRILSASDVGVQLALDTLDNSVAYGAATTWALADGLTKAITHGYATTSVIVQIFDIATGETIYVDSVVRTDANTVTLSSSDAPPVGGWTVLILRVG